MASRASKGPPTGYQEFAVRRERFNQFFDPPLARSTFHDFVNKGKILPVKGICHWHGGGGLSAAYFFKLGGGTGTGPAHFPVAVLVPITRPEASRWVLVADPGLPLVAVLPVSRPEASRYCVLLPRPLPVRVSACPTRRPLASR